MQKHKKPTKNTTESPDSATDDIFAEPLAYLRQQIRAVIAGKAGEAKVDPAYRVATLTKMVAQVVAEQRKAASALRKQFTDYTVATVLAWARRDCTKDQRQQLVRELAAMDAGGSILS